MQPTEFTRPAATLTWINRTILIGSVLFVLGLTISAVFAPEWRKLHVLQALIYVAVVVLTRRNSAWGFGAGVFIATFWDGILLFTSTLLQDGFRELWSVISTGHLQRPDLIITLMAGTGHVLIIIACVAGFVRLRPGGRQWGQFVTGGVLAIGYLVAMVFAVGPPEGVARMRHVFGL